MTVDTEHNEWEHQAQSWIEEVLRIESAVIFWVQLSLYLALTLCPARHLYSPRHYFLTHKHSYLHIIECQAVWGGECAMVRGTHVSQQSTDPTQVRRRAGLTAAPGSRVLVVVNPNRWPGPCCLSRGHELSLSQWRGSRGTHVLLLVRPGRPGVGASMRDRLRPVRV